MKCNRLGPEPTLIMSADPSKKIECNRLGFYLSQAAKQRFLRLMSLVRTGEIEAADKAVKAALRVTPKDHNILQLGAHIAEQTKDIPRAISLYRRALLAHPAWMEVTFNLARLLGTSPKAKEREEATGLLEGAARHHPERPEIWEALARFAQKNGQLTQAITYWRKALSLRPNNPQGKGQYLFACRQLCIWDEETEPTSSFPPNITALLFDDPDLQKESAERFIAQNLGHLPALPAPPPYAHARKRIGYLSSDFHAHATAWLIAELFTLHDRTHFEVFAYSYGVDDGSKIRARLRREADHFIELNALTPQECATRIREDEIDILVDLKGHTTGGRLDILAYRPAPLQLHWLGFPATTGAPFIDAFVGDAITIPEGKEKHFTEEVWRLPNTYQINDRQKEIAAPKNKKACGLPEDKLVLASFNQSYKITPEVFDIWCNLLSEESGSILWLYASNDEACENLKAHAQECGVDPTRLFFAPPLPLDEHLARYEHVDLALDTFPIGGHTTTSDALWAGTPVVTMAGKSFISRVAASLLSAAELPQLVTKGLEEYKALCLDLMRNKDKRQALKKHLGQKNTALPLFDTPRFVRDWEGLLLAQKTIRCQ